MNTAKYGGGADFGFRPTTEQLKAEAFVYKERPALIEECDWCEGTGDGMDNPNHYTGAPDPCDKCRGKGYVKLPLNLQDWQAALNWTKKELHIGSDRDVYIVAADMGKYWLNIQFNLTTGQPATEADYRVFNKIVSV